MIEENTVNGTVHVLVDYNGLTYVSQNGNCVYINITQEKLTPRCNLCNKAEFLGSDYFGAENNKLHFDSYFVNKTTDNSIIDLSVILSVTEVNGYVIPVGEMGEFNSEGAEIDYGSDFVNFKITVESDSFDIPEPCKKQRSAFWNNNLRNKMSVKSRKGRSVSKSNNNFASFLTKGARSAYKLVTL